MVPTREIIVDPAGGILVSRTGRDRLRMRLVAALPLRGGRVVALQQVVVDPAGVALRDPLTGSCVGMPQVFVHRLAGAGRTEGA
jgi:hypothetical protein